MLQTKEQDKTSEGQLSADLVKTAIFNAADDINAQFESMPMTWGQIWQSMQNTALDAFGPILQRINDFANSDIMQSFVSGATEAMYVLASVVSGIFDMIGTVGTFIADNWSVISPIIYGVISALALYGTYLAITKGIELGSLAIKGILAVMQGIYAAALVLTTSATWATAQAQLGLNGAMYASPIPWIIILIVSLISIIIMLCNWIAETTGIASSGIGIIVGMLSVAVAFIGNLFVSFINATIDIFVILWNFIAT